MFQKVRVKRNNVILTLFYNLVIENDSDACGIARI